MAGSKDEWKLLYVVRGYHVYKYVWDLSQKHVFSWNAKFPQFSGTNSVVQTNVLFLLHGALAKNTLDNRGLLTISRYMWCHLDVVLVFLHLAIAFERALFPGLTTGCLTVFFSFFVDLKEQ